MKKIFFSLIVFLSIPSLALSSSLKRISDHSFELHGKVYQQGSLLSTVQGNCIIVGQPNFLEKGEGKITVWFEARLENDEHPNLKKRIISLSNDGLFANSVQLEKNDEDSSK